MVDFFPNTALVAPAEAAFIADISDRDVSRIVDERILPTSLYEQASGRRFWKLACALASFYFSTDKDLTKSLRQDVIERITEKVFFRADHEEILSLSRSVIHGDWTIKVAFGTLELDDFVIQAQLRAQLVCRVHQLIVEDNDIMGGEPVYKGTRIPVHSIAANLQLGISADRISDAYPDLTKEMIDAASVYAKIRPRRGRPRRLSDFNPDFVKISTKRIPPPAA